MTKIMLSIPSLYLIVMLDLLFFLWLSSSVWTRRQATGACVVTNESTWTKVVKKKIKKKGDKNAISVFIKEVNTPLTNNVITKSVALPVKVAVWSTYADIVKALREPNGVDLVGIRVSLEL